MRHAFVLAAGIVLLLSCGKAGRDAGLQVTYGPGGLQRLTFNGVVLEDLAQYPADAFHIWHMKVTDSKGKGLAGNGYAWGEVNQGRTWDAATHTMLYKFPWGSISTQFSQIRDALALKVVEENQADSGVTLRGATIYPLVLHFPDLPSGFGDASYEHLAVKTDDPPPVADFGQGKVTVVAEAGAKPLYRGFEPAGHGNNYFPVISSTTMDSMAAFYPRVDRPVPPGKKDVFTIRLQFAASEGETQ